MALHEWELHGGAYLVVGEGVCLRHDGGGVRGLLSAAGVVRCAVGAGCTGGRQMMMVELGVEVHGGSSGRRLAIARLQLPSTCAGMHCTRAMAHYVRQR